MGSAVYSIKFDGVLEAGLGTIIPGQCVCLNSTGDAYIVSTIGNRGGQRTSGVVTFTSSGGKAVQIQSDGICSRTITQIPFLEGADNTPIRVNNGGLIERADPIVDGDEIVGSCNKWGDALLTFGQPTSSLIGTLAGDCVGPPTSNVVEAIRGVAILNLAPTNKQVLTASGPTDAEWDDPIVTMGTDISGPSNDATVDAIKHTTIETAGGSLVSGDVLTVTGPFTADWQTPAAITSVTMGGDVTGNSATSTVVAVQGIAVSATDPTAGQVLTAIDGVSADWETPLVTMGGDISGPSNSASVDAVKGVIVSATPPTSGQVLTATDGTHADWETPVVVTEVTMGGEVTGLSSNATVIAINGIQVGVASVTAGDILTITSVGQSNWLPPAVATMGGDVTGNTATNRVTSISGGSIGNGVAMATGVHLDYGGGSITDASGRYQWTGSFFSVNPSANLKSLFGSISTTQAGLWFGSNTTTPSTSNYSFLVDATTTYLLASSEIILTAPTRTTLVSPTLRFLATVTSPSITQGPTSGAPNNLTISAQSTGQSNTSGGDLILEAGAKTGTAKTAGVQVLMGDGSVMMQAADATASGAGRVLALCVGTPIAGEVPSSGGGDRVAFLSDCNTQPNTNPTNGGILFGVGGKSVLRTSSGFVKYL